MTTDKPWYTVIIAGLLALACLGGAFYCIVFTGVEAAVYAQFFTFAGLLVGYIIGQAAPASMTTLLNRSSVVASAPDPQEGLQRGGS